MSLISQTLSPIVTPGLREALLFGGERAEWERLFDDAATFKHDEAVLRVLESEARREEHRRELERRLIRCAPAPAAACVARPHIFRALFQKDIAGVSGASDVWWDADFIAVDGGTGRLQSWVDYVDSANLLTQIAVGNQCALPAADATMAGAKTALFTVAGTTKYVCNKALGLLRFLHDLSGSEIVIVATPQTTTGTGVWLTTRTSAVGATVYRGSGGAHGYYVQPGSGSAGNINLGTALIVGTGTYVDESATAGTSGQIARLKSTTQATATPTSGSAQDPQNALTVGTDTSNYAAMNLRAIYITRRVRTAADRAVCQQFIQKDTGITP